MSMWKTCIKQLLHGGNLIERNETFKKENKNIGAIISLYNQLSSVFIHGVENVVKSFRCYYQPLWVIRSLHPLLFCCYLHY